MNRVLLSSYFFLQGNERGTRGRERRERVRLGIHLVASPVPMDVNGGDDGARLGQTLKPIPGTERSNRWLS